MGLLNTGEKYGVDVKRVLVVGDSAGGNLAAAVSHYLAMISEKYCRRNFLKAQVCSQATLNYRKFSNL